MKIFLVGLWFISVGALCQISDNNQGVSQINPLLEPSLVNQLSEQGRDRPPAGTQIDPGKVVKFRPILAKQYRSGEIDVEVDLWTGEGFTIYKDELKLIAPAGYNVEILEAPEPLEIDDPVTGGRVLVYRKGRFILRFRGIEALEGTISFGVKFTGCTKDFCLFPFTQQVGAKVLPTEEQLPLGADVEIVEDLANPTSKPGLNNAPPLPAAMGSANGEDRSTVEGISADGESWLIYLGVLAAFLVLAEIYIYSRHRKLSWFTPLILLAVLLLIYHKSQTRQEPPSPSAGADEVILLTDHWIGDEKAAFAKAKAEGKHVFIDNWADWCTACKKMEVETFTDPEVIDFLLNRFVLLKFDLTDESEFTEKIMERYEIQVLPTMLMIDPTDNRRTVIPKFLDADEFLEAAKKFSSKSQQ